MKTSNGQVHVHVHQKEWECKFYLIKVPFSDPQMTCKQVRPNQWRIQQQQRIGLFVRALQA